MASKTANVDRKALGTLLRKELKKKKLSQKDLGEAVNKSQAWVSRVLRGDAKRLPAYQLLADYLMPEADAEWMTQASRPKRSAQPAAEPAAPAAEPAAEPVAAAPADAEPANLDEVYQRIDALSASVSSLTSLVRQLVETRAAGAPEASIAGTNTLPSGDVLVFRGDGQVFVVSHEDGNVYRAKGLELPTEDISAAWPTRPVRWQD